MGFLVAPRADEEDMSDLPTHLPGEQPGPEGKDKKEEVGAEEPALSRAVPDQPKARGRPDGLVDPRFNISIETDEDLAKWIAERKKNWPTNKRVEEKRKRQAEAPAPPEKEPPAKRPKTVCRFFQAQGRCKFGNKCKFSHEKGAAGAGAGAGAGVVVNGVNIFIPKKYSNDHYQRERANPSSSLYKMLVQRDLYEHENTTVLDFIQYLDAQGKIDHSQTKGLGGD